MKRHGAAPALFGKVPSDKSESAKPNQHFAPMKSKCFADSANRIQSGGAKRNSQTKVQTVREFFWGTNELTNLERSESSNYKGSEIATRAADRIEYTKYPSFVRYKWYNIEATCDACEEDYPKPSPR